MTIVCQEKSTHSQSSEGLSKVCKVRPFHNLMQRQTLNGQTASTLDFTGHTVSVATTQLCCCNLYLPHIAHKRINVAVRQ